MQMSPMRLNKFIKLPKIQFEGTNKTGIKGSVSAVIQEARVCSWWLVNSF
jgi:hypothetical protein